LRAIRAIDSAIAWKSNRRSFDSAEVRFAQDDRLLLIAQDDRLYWDGMAVPALGAAFCCSHAGVILAGD
jgi:hypothetical protein